MNTKLFTIATVLVVAGCTHTVSRPITPPKPPPMPVEEAMAYPVSCSRPLDPATIPDEPLAGILHTQGKKFLFSTVQGSSRLEFGDQTNLTLYNKPRDGICSKTPTGDFGQLVDMYLKTKDLKPGTYTYSSDNPGSFAQINYTYLDKDLVTHSNAIVSQAVYIIDEIDGKMVSGKAAVCWENGSAIGGTFKADRCLE
ncbi:MAG: hypothetical protein Q7S89_03170 [bacterium]|nr:hypothetical protein [bacterium]